MKKSFVFVGAALVCSAALAAFVAVQMTSGSIEETSVRETQPVEAIETGPFALHVRGAVDYAQLKAHGLPTIVDYGSESCLPCRQMAPVLSKLNRELEGKALIKFVDVRKYREAAIGIPIRLIPSQILIDSKGRPFSPSETLAKKIAFVRVESKDERLPGYTVHEGSLTEQQMREILAEMGN